jgi:HAMP domain-containing protein/HPt (histidine-containing phosphotransfer) domain-containing protein
MSTSAETLRKSEQSIRATLIDKGQLLVKNNSQALMGMVDDNAFSAVQDLVSSTVRDDIDMVYGIYMDVEKQPWVHARPDNESGAVSGSETLEDETSLWAAGITELTNKIVTLDGVEVYEFASPIIVEEEVLGFLRYGFSTQRMQKSLAEESEASQATLIQTILILVGVGFVAIFGGFNATRQIAGRITEPLNDLTSAAETIAEGDYSSEVVVESNDEIGTLANNFETMRSTINKKMSDLATLNSIGEVLAVLLDQNKALEEVLKTMHSHCGVSQGSVFLMNERNDLVVKGFYPPKKMKPDAQPVKFTMGEGVLGRAAQNKEIVFVSDTSKDPHFVDAKGDTPPMALLCIPLMDKDMLIGVMNFNGKVGDVTFEESDFEFASSVARLLVITIKNIRMREVIEEQNRTLEHKVEERTQALQEKTNDILSMMQNMHQGLFTIMEGGIIHHEYAAYLEAILETDRIANRNFMDLLFRNTNLGSDRCDQVATAVEALLGSDEMMFDFNSHLLANEIVISLDDDRTKILELDWDPIIMNGDIDKIMVTVRDVTALKELQAAAEEQARELEIIGHILSIDSAKFNEFITSANDFIDECHTLIKANENKDADVIATLFRNMHTVKGNARTFGFNYITNSVHNVENTYDELRKIEDKEWNQSELLYELKLAEVDVQRYQNVAKEKLGREDSQQSDDGMANVDRERVNALIASIESLELSDLPDSVKSCFKETYQTLVSFDAKPIEEAIQPVLESAASLSDELNKPTPEMEMNSGGIYIKKSAHSMLNNIFMHVFRNAIDHGIETPDVRAEKGKAEKGTICLDTIKGDGFVEFVIKDDGKGLAISRLYQKAVEEGVYQEGERPPASDIANLIFGSGFSTAEQITEVSGRGVGMDAVKQFLEKEGGSINVALDDGEETADFRTFATKITLPEQFYVVTPEFGVNA